MSYEVVFTDTFKDCVKHLKKRYPSVADDVKQAIHVLMGSPAVGNVIPNSNGVRKLRLRNSSVNKGKSGGFRLFYFVKDEPRATLWFLLLISKNEQEDVEPELLRKALRQVGD